MEPEKQLHDVYDAKSRSVALPSLPASLLANETAQYDYSQSKAIRRPLDFSSIASSSRGFVLDNIFSAEECAELVRATEEAGFDCHSDVSAEYPSDYRSNVRLIVLNEQIAKTIWARLLPHLFESDVRDVTPVGFATEGTWLPVGVNECLLFSRYKEGQFFKQHFDGLYKNYHGDCSIFTITIYLNDDYEGGKLLFLPETAPQLHRDSLPPALVFQPVRGSALIFNHDTLHEGEQVYKGSKYILRTSIMFRRVENLADPLRGWEANPDWQRMREVFSSFTALNAAGDPKTFTSRYLECQAIQVKHNRSVHCPEPLPLPEDIFIHIFGEIDFKELVSTFRVSKSWKSAARSGRLWRARLLREFGLRWESIASTDSLLAKMDPGLVYWFSIYRRIYRTSRAVFPLGVFVGFDTIATNLDRSKQVRFPSFIKDISDPWDASFTHWLTVYRGEIPTNRYNDELSIDISHVGLLLEAAQNRTDKNNPNEAAMMLVVDPRFWRTNEDNQLDTPVAEWAEVRHMANLFERRRLGSAFGVITTFHAALVHCNVPKAVVVSCCRVPHEDDSNADVSIAIVRNIDVEGAPVSVQTTRIKLVDLADGVSRLVCGALAADGGVRDVIFITSEQEVHRDLPVKPKYGNPADALRGPEYNSDYYLRETRSRINYVKSVTSEFSLPVIEEIKARISGQPSSALSSGRAVRQHYATPLDLAHAAIKAPFSLGSKLHNNWLFMDPAFQAIEAELLWSQQQAANQTT